MNQTFTLLLVGAWLGGFATIGVIAVVGAYLWLAESIGGKDVANMP